MRFSTQFARLKVAIRGPKMKRIKIAIVISFVMAGITMVAGDRYFMTTVRSYSTGPPAGFSGAPDEASCAACHTGGLTGPGQFVIVGLPATYTPGQTYQVTVRHTTTDQTRLRWGFEMTSLDSAGMPAGTFGDVSGTTQHFVENGRDYIEHTLSGSFGGQPNGAQWNVNWIAPPTNVGPVTLYAAGNQANNDGSSGGDQIYVAQATVNSAGGTPSPTPTATPTSTPTSTPTATPTATPTPAGLESDVAPRQSGDGAVLSNDVVQIRRFVVGLDIPNTSPNEFQRADSAPLASRGDGVINATDTVQARRYVTGLDTPQPAGGPTEPAAGVVAEARKMLVGMFSYFSG